jgi:hypothetical protein
VAEATLTPPTADEPAYPRSWIWDDDGDIAAGTYVKADRAPTRDYGPKTVVVLEIEGVERSIWLLNDALFNKFRQEIAARPGRQLTPGERVIVQRLEEKISQSSGRKYRDFRAYFPDKPPPTIEDLWGADIGETKPEPKSEMEVEAAAGNASDDSIPF